MPVIQAFRVRVGDGVKWVGVTDWNGGKYRVGGSFFTVLGVSLEAALSGQELDFRPSDKDYTIPEFLEMAAPSTRRSNLQSPP